MKWVSVLSSTISRIAYYCGEIYIDRFEEGIFACRAPETHFYELLNTSSKEDCARQVLDYYPVRKIVME